MPQSATAIKAIILLQKPECFLSILTNPSIFFNYPEAIGQCEAIGCAFIQGMSSALNDFLFWCVVLLLDMVMRLQG